MPDQKVEFKNFGPILGSLDVKRASNLDEITL